jgi:hypothetical protein
MCTVQHGFKFCTCEKNELDKPGSKIPEYTWHLTRFAGIDQDGPMGSIVAPSRELGEGFTVQNILQVLNSGTGFDFTYFPADKDCLQISRSAKDSGYEYMSFLYQNGAWSEGMNPPFTTKIEEISKGGIFK